MHLIYPQIFLFLFTGRALSVQLRGCYVAPNSDLAEPQPLILTSTDPPSFVLPSPESGKIELRTGDTIVLRCSGGGNHFAYINSLGSRMEINVTTATCISDSDFHLDAFDTTSSLSELTCSTYPSHTAMRTGSRCNGKEIIDVGFQIENDFLSLYKVCHDDDNLNTIMSISKIPSTIGASQKSFPRPLFAMGDFYEGIDVARSYSKKGQRGTLTELLQSAELAESYIPLRGTHYLTRGHLTPKTDFIFGAHQRTTFYYVNVAPIWQCINAGNWELLEIAVRKLAEHRGLDLDVYTGTIGISKLPDVNGIEKNLYLALDENNNGVIPVPKFIWKVIHDSVNNNGIAFVTVNNPYETELTDELELCKDICSQVPWLKWNAADPDRGLSYCCTVDDFRRSVDELPVFEVKDIIV